MKKFCVFLFSTIIQFVHGQSWSQVDNGLNGFGFSLHQMQSKLYISTLFGSVYSWDNNILTDLNNPTSTYNYALIDYNGSLYFGGRLPSMSYGVVGEYSGSNWGTNSLFSQPGDIAQINDLCVYNNKLIAGGFFTYKVPSNPKVFNNIASWNGTQWDSLKAGLQINNGNGAVHRLCIHDNKLVVSGNFTKADNNTTIKYIAQWNDTVWKSLSTSHVFKTSGRKPMYSFNGNLIIGNVWDTINSVPMNGIAVWNGSSFFSMGGNFYMDTTGFDGIQDFAVVNNEIFCSAKYFNSSSSNYENVVLKWVGSSWTQIGGIFNAPVWSISGYNNELYAAGSFTNCAGTPMTYLAKNSLIIGVKENEATSNAEVFPNPFSSALTITGKYHNATVTLTNIFGQVNFKWNGFINNTLNIPMQSLSEGLYYINITENGKEIVRKKLIKIKCD